MWRLNADPRIVRCTRQLAHSAAAKAPVACHRGARAEQAEVVRGVHVGHSDRARSL